MHTLLSSHEDPSVSIALIRTLVDEVVRAGGEPDVFLAAARLDRARLDDPNARIALSSYDRLQELALDITGDPALGLHMADRALLPTFHVVGTISLHCHTIREAIDVFSRYRRLLSDCAPPSLVEDGDRATLTFFFLEGARERCNRLRAEFGVAALLKFSRTLAQSAVRSAVAEFTHRAPEYEAEYARVLGCPARFSCEATRIVFERRMLDAPQLHANTEVQRLLETQAEEKLSGLSSERAPALVSARVRALVAEQYDGTKPTMPAIARQLALSARSLRRRLRAEGRTYGQVVEGALADVACRLLRDRAASIQEIAHRLGFSEPSAFHRAFKRWTGLTPTQFRADASA